MVKLSLLTALLLVLINTAIAEVTPVTARVEYRDAPVTYRLDGVVEAVNQSTIAAQTSGQVERILFDVDDTVKKGAVVVQLKNTEQKAQLEQAEAEVSRATARHREAQDEYRRVKGIYDKALVSKSSLDKAKSTLEATGATRAFAQASLEQASEQLDYTTVRAPYSGVVTQRHVELGEIASPGQPLISGLSLDQLRVRVDVPQSLIETIRTQKMVWVQLNKETTLEIDDLTIFPIADAKSNTFKVRINLPTGTAAAYPGMFVKTEFITGEQRHLAIPTTGVVYRSEVTGVYVVDSDGRIRFRYIRVGNISENRIDVLAGLEQGEMIALDPIAAGAALKKQRRATHHE